MYNCPVESHLEYHLWNNYRSMIYTKHYDDDKLITEWECVNYSRTLPQSNTDTQSINTTCVVAFWYCYCIITVMVGIIGPSSIQSH